MDNRKFTELQLRILVACPIPKSPSDLERQWKGEIGYEVIRRNMHRLNLMDLMIKRESKSRGKNKVFYTTRLEYHEKALELLSSCSSS